MKRNLACPAAGDELSRHHDRELSVLELLDELLLLLLLLRLSVLRSV